MTGPPADGPVPNGACGGCALAGRGTRRDFLRDVLRDAAAAVLALGLPATALATPPVPAPRPRAVRGALTYPLPAQDAVLVDREHDVILVRWENAVYAFALACPHQRVALRWLERDGRFQCPKHKSKYSPDGAFIEGRATRGMDRLAVRREGERVVVETGRLLKQSDDPSAWEAAALRL